MGRPSGSYGKPGLSRKSLADKLGISLASLNRWEKDKKVPRNSSLEILDDYFESDLERRFGVLLKTEEPAADEEVTARAAPAAPLPPKAQTGKQFPSAVGKSAVARPSLAQADGPAGCAHCPALANMAAALNRLTEVLQIAH